MGRHREWRKIAKRERRRRIRTQIAITRDDATHLTSEEYEKMLEDEKAIEMFELQQIDKTNKEENYKWMEAEKNAIEQWRKLQIQKALFLQHSIQQETKRKQEFEMEQERKKKEEERLKILEEQNKKRQEEFMGKLELFMSGDSVHPPPELLVSRQTKPEMEACPFFSKTACCRFGDQCSRNHKYPGISNVLLATNFYSHFGLENATYNEYDTDVMLEYEESDTFKDFKVFFYDVLPEFEKFGRIVQFKVCNNFEKHLRGNTYVQYEELRCAVAAYRSLHGRWYGGKQISLQFCHISSWKNAVCGLQARKRCPKGRTCNFLHVFRNPNNMFPYLDVCPTSSRSRKSSSRSWRWSESPEVDMPCRRRSRSRSRHRLRRSDKADRRESSSRRHSHSSRRSHRSRRRSSERSWKDNSP